MISNFKCNETDLYKNGIYKIINLTNSKVYIGQVFCKNGFYRRWVEHISKLTSGKHHNSHLQRAWNKYGRQNFEFHIIEIIEDENIIDEREIYWISYYNSFLDKNKGYNLCAGGCGTRGFKFSKEQKEKLSKALIAGGKLKNRKLSEEHKNKIREALKGRFCGSLNPNYGKSPSEETKRKLSLAHCGEDSSFATITNIQVTKIKEKLCENFSVKEISNMFDISKDIIEHIKYLKTWKNISPELNDIFYAKTKRKKNIKFSYNEIICIRKFYLNGYSTRKLALMFDCSKTYIGFIINFQYQFKNIHTKYDDELRKYDKNKQKQKIKLSKSQIENIRNTYKNNNYSYDEIAEKFKLSVTTTWEIIHYKSRFH